MVYEPNIFERYSRSECADSVGIMVCFVLLAVDVEVSTSVSVKGFEFRQGRMSCYYTGQLNQFSQNYISSVKKQYSRYNKHRKAHEFCFPGQIGKASNMSGVAPKD